MSISSECSPPGLKSHENTIFTRTFSFMREYLKENRPVGELNFAAAAAAATPAPYYDISTQPDLNLMPINSFFQQSDLPEMVSVNNAQTAEPENAQMTVFYAGNVYVFNDLPANKANDIMFLASLGSSNTIPFPSNNIVTPDQRYLNFPQPIDLPMKRKASLTRFFEKRKDRIKARAPYNVSEESQAPLKLNESKSWLSLAST